MSRQDGIPGTLLTMVILYASAIRISNRMAPGNPPNNPWLMDVPPEAVSASFGLLHGFGFVAVLLLVKQTLPGCRLTPNNRTQGRSAHAISDWAVLWLIQRFVAIT